MPAESQEKPTLRNVVPADLGDTGRLLVLFEEATRKGLFRNTERDRLDFVARAEHARIVGTKNPCGLFAKLVHHREWDFVTEGDDDAAHRRLKVHFYGDPRSRGDAPAPKPAVKALSDDAQFVRSVRQLLRNQGVALDPFLVVSKAKPDWTKDRWDAAAKELDDVILTKAASAHTLGSLLASVRVPMGEGTATIMPGVGR